MLHWSHDQSALEFEEFPHSQTLARAIIPAMRNVLEIMVLSSSSLFFACVRLSGPVPVILFIDTTPRKPDRQKYRRPQPIRSHSGAVLRCVPSARSPSHR
jgi:hypothetical protein